MPAIPMFHRVVCGVRRHRFLILSLLLAACSDSQSTGSRDAAADMPDEGVSDALDTADAPDADAADGASDGVALDDVLDLVEIGDAGGDVIPRTVGPAGQDPAGHPDILAALEPGEVRAGQVSEAGAGIGGVQAACRPGDFKLYNARVAFCVAGTEPTTLFDFTGGQLVDADRVGADNDRFFLLGVHNHFNVSGGTSVEVVDDGRDELAVVRVRGPEEPVRILAEIIGLVLPLRGVSFETEYRLRPDEDYLEIVSWVRAEDGTTTLRAGDIPLFGDSSKAFFPGYGRVLPADDVGLEFAASTAPGRSYALYAPEGLLTMGVDFSQLGSSYDILPLIERTGRIDQGREGSFRRYLIVGDGGTGDVRAAIAAIDGAEVPGQRLVVTAKEAGEPVEGVILVVYDADGDARDALVTDAEGAAELALPPGDYAVGPEDWVGGPVLPADVTVTQGSDATVDLDLPQAARLAFQVDALDGGGEAAPSPALIMLYGPRPERIFVAHGTHEGLFRSGTYRIVISRGEEFTAAVLNDVVLEPGANDPIAVTLERVWDTDGLVSGEFHQHMTNSPDSNVAAADRLMSNIVAGVDFVVPTDHEYVTDYGPVIDALDVGHLIHAMPSQEVSPLAGHLNPMPMTPDPTRAGNGAYAKARFDPVARTLDIFTFPEIVADLRANYGVRVVQLNHPRDGFGQFDTADYDPVVGPDGANAMHFTTDFESIEVFNQRSVFCEVFDDWVSLVARGYPITGVGNSDTHSLRSPAGYPRSYLPSDATRPDEVTDEEILSAIEDGHISVSGGALLTFPGGPAMGELLDVSGSPTFELPVRIQTPTWSTVDTLVVLVDAKYAETIELDAAVEDVVAFDDTLELDAPESDSYLIAVTWGDAAMPIVTPGERPFGFTNPIYLDADGDGHWTPPGIQSDEDLPHLQVSWCQ